MATGTDWTFAFHTLHGHFTPALVLLERSLQTQRLLSPRSKDPLSARDREPAAHTSGVRSTGLRRPRVGLGVHPPAGRWAWRCFLSQTWTLTNSLVKTWQVDTESTRTCRPRACRRDRQPAVPGLAGAPPAQVAPSCPDAKQ